MCSCRYLNRKLAFVQLATKLQSWINLSLWKLLSWLFGIFARPTCYGPIQDRLCGWDLTRSWQFWDWLVVFLELLEASILEASEQEAQHGCCKLQRIQNLSVGVAGGSTPGQWKSIFRKVLPFSFCRLCQIQQGSCCCRPLPFSPRFWRSLWPSTILASRQVLGVYCYLGEVRKHWVSCKVWVHVPFVQFGIVPVDLTHLHKGKRGRACRLKCWII